MATARKTAATSASKDVVKESNKPVFSEAQLSGVASFADAIALLNSQSVPSDSILDYGSGFALLDNKDKVQLLGVPFVAVEWAFRPGDHGEYVSVVVVTEKDDKYILNDGSTGIYKQLREITDKRLADGRGFAQAGLAVNNGLRVSNYEYEDAKTGELKPASTYYLA